MKIGELELDTVEPTEQDLRERLLSANGLSLEETRDALGYPQMASSLAGALAPFLAEPMERHALAEAIEGAGVANVQAEIRVLYANALTPKEEAPVAKAAKASSKKAG